MRYIVTPQQMRAIEEDAFLHGIASLDLMERAAEGIVEELGRMIGLAGKRVIFFCGKGNNGGDALAAARLFVRQGGEAIILMMEPPATAGARQNEQKARAMGIPIEKDIPSGMQFDAAVDGLIGIGYHQGQLPAHMIEAIEGINALGCPVLAVDVPSGMDALTGQCPGPCVRADRTLSFGWEKTGHHLSIQAEWVGKLVSMDIGLAAFGKEWQRIETLEQQDIRALLPKRSKTAHKGDNGRVLLYCGSVGMAGAAAMAALGCLRAGAGLVYIACEEAIIPILQVLVPNAQCIPVDKAVYDVPKHDVLLAGSGLGKSDKAYENLLRLYEPATPTVLDADALNMLSTRPFELGEHTVLTPHVGEAARLLGQDASDLVGDILGAAQRLNERYGATIALKSHCTVIAQGERLSLNTIGSPALSKGGSGDALAGIIAGLMAQGLSGYEAARLGCLWFGQAARLAEAKMGVHSPITGDVLALMGEATL